MAYSVGDTVVSVHHGTGVVESTERRQLDGEAREYLVLRMSVGELTMLVPADRCREVGIRDVVTSEQVEQVLAVLRQTRAERPGSWSRRFKENAERIRSGDVLRVAEAVRNLTIRDLDGNLSAGERRMLATAKELLLAELSVAMGRTPQELDDELRQLMLEAHAAG